METRTTTEVKVYMLTLSPVRGTLGEKHVVVLAFERENLVQWYRGQLADKAYQVDGYYRYFKEGTPLEHYCDVPKQIFDIGETTAYGTGISEKWVSLESLKQTKIPIIDG